MKSTTNGSTELDEVERCRQVRRELERTDGGFDGLCDWLETLEKQRKTSQARRKKRKKLATAVKSRASKRA